MKKLISVLLIFLLILASALALAGCDTPSVSVSSVMDITPAFKGTRTITVRYPLSVDIDAIKDTIIADDPASGAEGASFTYRGVEEDGYYFELSFSFENNSEYEEQVGAVIGRTAASFLSVKDTALTKGVRMAEDFSLEDLIGWIIRDTAAASSTRDLRFDTPSNTINIGSESFTTGSQISVNSVEGSTVNSVSIRTSNDKEGSYDRTFVFAVPNDTYLVGKDSLEQYFLANTAPAAKYSGWSSEGANMLYTVIYEKLSADELREYTAMLLDTDNSEIFYGDKDNSSTPLSEGLTFEESLDTFSFIGPDKGAPALEYSYSLPTNTTHGDGAVFSDGRWTSAGRWEDGVYKLDLSSGSVKLRIPDGIQYAINGIEFSLVSLGGERFSRSTSFLYSKTDGYDGRNYAYEFFLSKGAEAVLDEDDDDLICTVVSEGTTAEITDELVKLFGSGNFLAYRRSESAFALSAKTNLTDYISLGSMLNASNANRPMTYTVRSSCEENIVSVSVDGSETAYRSPSKSVLTITGGNAAVEYRGNIPIRSHIIIYCLIGAGMLLLTSVIAVLMLRRRTKKVSPEARKIIDSIAPDEGEDDPSAPSLSQTTTFSIFELGALSRNKKYVEEINKDIEKRIEADRLKEIKDEIRAKQLEEMERKVYGDPQDGAEEPQAPEEEPDDPETQDIHEEREEQETAEDTACDAQRILDASEALGACEDETPEEQDV